MRYVFLVGGFAESKALQHRVRNELERQGRRVIVPQRPGLAVLRGAVMLGLGASERFASRVARRTYAVECSTPYDPANPDHAGRRTVQRMDQGRLTTFVTGQLSVIVRHGTPVRVKEVHPGKELFISGDGPGTVVNTFVLYTMEDPTSLWTDTPGTVKIGTIHVNSKPGNRVRVDLTFGTSEIRASVVDLTAGTVTPGVIQYDFSRVGESRGGGPPPPPPLAAARPAGVGARANKDGRQRRIFLFVCRRSGPAVRRLLAAVAGATGPGVDAGQRWRRAFGDQAWEAHSLASLLFGGHPCPIRAADSESCPSAVRKRRAAARRALRSCACRAAAMPEVREHSVGETRTHTIRLDAAVGVALRREATPTPRAPLQTVRLCSIPSICSLAGPATDRGPRAGCAT